MNTIIGFIQENKANDSLNKLKKMVEHKALVLRDGQEIEMDASFLTIGDVVILLAGNKVPADVRIIEAKDLQINEANLTGESVPSTKSIEKLEKGASLADRDNMAYASTVVVRGSGVAVITAIGVNTEIGKIADLVSSTEEEKTPLPIRLVNLSKFIGNKSVFGCITISGKGVWPGKDFFEMVNTRGGSSQGAAYTRRIDPAADQIRTCFSGSRKKFATKNSFLRGKILLPQPRTLLGVARADRLGPREQPGCLTEDRGRG